MRAPSRAAPRCASGPKAKPKPSTECARASDVASLLDTGACFGIRGDKLRAFRALERSSIGLVLVTGSLHLAGAVRVHLIELAQPA